MFELFKTLAKQQLIERPAFRKAVYAIAERKYPKDWRRLPAAGRALADAIIDKEFMEGLPPDPQYAADMLSMPLNGQGFKLWQ